MITARTARAASLAVLLIPALAAAQPKKLGYQGRLLAADGSAVSGVVDVTFAVYDAPVGGQKLWEEVQHLAFTDGFYATFLGEVAPFPATLYDGGERYLELVIGGAALIPRQRVGSVAYALRAGEARNVAGGVVDASSVSIGGTTVIDAGGRLSGPARYLAGPGVVIDDAQRTISVNPHCDVGQVLKWNGSDWACTPDFSPGTGLSLTGTTFSLLKTCGVGDGLAWDGSTWTCTPAAAAASGLVASAPLLATSVGSAVSFSISPPSAATQFLRANNAGTGWLAGPIDAPDLPALAGDVAGAYEATTVGKLQGTPVATTAPSGGQVLKFDGASGKWAPGADIDTDTIYSAGTGISVSSGTIGNTGLLSITAAGPLSAATTSGAAALSLGTVGVANGGTGITTAPSTGKFLRGSGSSWTVDAIATTDLPSLAGDVGGGYGANTVAKLQGTPVSTTAPTTTGQVLKFDATAGKWAPGTDNNTTYSAGTGISVSSGTIGNTGLLSLTAAGPLSATTTSGAAALSLGLVGVANGGTGITTAPATGKFLRGSGTSWTVGSIAATDLPAPGGDLSGYGPSTVVGLQGVPVSATAPAAGQVLKADSAGQWAPAADSSSQWANGSSGAIGYAGGNVGIGTASPNATLDVVGTFRYADGNQAAGKVLLSDATGVAHWQNPQFFNQQCAAGTYLVGFDATGTKICTASVIKFKKAAEHGGARHNCAIMTDDTVLCWGNNSSGQLGNNTVTEADAGVPVRRVSGDKLSGVTSLSLGFYGTCAVAGGKVYYWGDNSDYQGNGGATADSWLATEVPNVTTSSTQAVTQVSCGGYHVCALVSDTSTTPATSVRCWGLNSNGQLGDNTTTSSSASKGVVNAIFASPYYGVSSISAGGTYTCAVMKDDPAKAPSDQHPTVRCWGDNPYGEVGDNTTVDKHIPTQVIFASGAALTDVTQVAAGIGYYYNAATYWYNHTCARKSDGTAWCWGRGGYGELGNNGTANSSVPVQVMKSTAAGDFLTGVSEVYTGSMYSCALLSDGSARCWGIDNHYQLGDGATTQRTVANLLVNGMGGSGTLSNIKGLALGGSYNNVAGDKTLAVLNDGTAVAWGYNGYGEIGDNSTTERPNPVGVVQP